MYCLDASRPISSSPAKGQYPLKHVHRTETRPKYFLGAISPYRHLSLDSGSAPCQVFRRSKDTHQHNPKLLVLLPLKNTYVFQIFAYQQITSLKEEAFQPPIVGLLPCVSYHTLSYGISGLSIHTDTLWQSFHVHIYNQCCTNLH